MPDPVLVVDDEQTILNALTEALTGRGHEVVPRATFASALDAIRSRMLAAAVLDIRLDQSDGIELLRMLKELQPEVACVMLTAYDDPQTVVRAMKLGAEEYFVKPPDLELFCQTISQAVRNTAERRSLEGYRTLVLDDGKIAFFEGAAPETRAILEKIGQAAKSPDTPVLIVGETGTGKKMLTRYLHRNSPRRNGPYVSYSCLASGPDEVATELFGIDARRAGDVVRRPGRIELARTGTLVLDKIEALPLEAQAQLVKTIDEKIFHRVGSSRPESADVRLAVTTGAKLDTLVTGGAFRQDLYYRLNVVEIEIPPLRRRETDIPAFASFFLEQASAKFGKRFAGFDGAAVEFLAGRAWSGNLTELKNAMERIALLEEGGTLGRQHCEFLDGATPGPAAPDFGDGPWDFEQMLDDYAEKFIRHVIRKSGGNLAEVTRRLGLSRGKLDYQIRRLGIRKSK